MFLSILILPFLGAIFAGFLGRKLGIMGSQLISIISLFLSALLSSLAFYDVCISNNPVWINIGTWIDSEIFTVSWEFSFDQLSVVFCIMITYITFLILVYTVYYMQGNPLSVVGKRNEGEELSNSGNTLKIIIPNYSRKMVSGWTNHSGKVISYNMSESEMGYRGSKSKLILKAGGAKTAINFVKEQRADGSWCFSIEKFLHLRCALMDFERNFQVNVLSK